MTTAPTAERFTALPDELALAATVTALEEHGFSVEELGAARTDKGLHGSWIAARSLHS